MKEVPAEMPAVTDSLAAVVQTVLAELLDLPAQPGPALAEPPRPALRASVRVNGAWEGAVVLDCPEELAGRLAATMLGQPPGRAQVADAIGELANVVTGNLKVLLPAPSWLSLPSVDAPPAGAPLGRVVAQATVTCHGQPLTVRVLEAPGA